MGNLLNTKKKSLVSPTESVTRPTGSANIEDQSIHAEPSTGEFLNEYQGRNGQNIGNPSEEKGELRGGLGMNGKKSGMSDMTKGVIL